MVWFTKRCLFTECVCVSVRQLGLQFAYFGQTFILYCLFYFVIRYSRHLVRCCFLLVHMIEGFANVHILTHGRTHTRLFEQIRRFVHTIQVEIKCAHTGAIEM